MKNLAALFMLFVIGLLTGCKLPPTAVLAQTTEKKVGGVYKAALVQSPLGCTMSPLAWTSEETNHYIIILGFGSGDRKVAVVKVLEEVRGLPVGAPEVCKSGEVTHVPTSLLQIDKDLSPQK